MSDELPPLPPFSSRRITATIRPTAPPPTATGEPEMPRRSLTCDGSRRARRRMRMAAALPALCRHEASTASARRDIRGEPLSGGSRRLLLHVLVMPVLLAVVREGAHSV